MITYLVALSVCTVPAPTDGNAWRSQKVGASYFDAGRLDVVVADLARISGCPIHFVHGYLYDEMPLLRRAEFGRVSSTLGNAFDEIALQVPGMVATATPNGVLWRCPLNREASKPLDSVVELDQFSGDVDRLMVRLFMTRVRHIATNIAVPGWNEPSKTKVSTSRLRPMRAIDALVQVADANDFNVVVRVVADSSTAGAGTPQADKPSLDYFILTRQPKK